MANVATYMSQKVIITFGSHKVSGTADGSFVAVEQSGDGVTKTVGAYGDVQRSVSPDTTSSVTLTLLWNSPTNAWLRNKLKQDRANGSGLFPVLITDLVGGTKFTAEEAWVVKEPTLTYDLTAQNVEWTVETGQSEVIN
ncbi:MAG: DUF3277 family protein [Oscillospiraceae bacterium]|jgi:hypothetical protein|nr:DUF3277 family protein [Oscillospiraceae bacterium]